MGISPCIYLDMVLQSIVVDENWRRGAFTFFYFLKLFSIDHHLVLTSGSVYIGKNMDIRFELIDGHS